MENTTYLVELLWELNERTDALSAVSCNKRSLNSIRAENVGTLPLPLGSSFTILVHVTHYLPFISINSYFGENQVRTGDVPKMYISNSLHSHGPHLVTYRLVQECFITLPPSGSGLGHLWSLPKKSSPLIWHLILSCFVALLPNRSHRSASVTKHLHRNFSGPAPERCI